MTRSREYVPALRYAFLTRFYDPVVAWTTRERAFKAALVEQASISPGHEILDLGCGTGTLALMIAERHPHARVTGVDGDSSILEIARRKAEGAGREICFERALAQSLPFPDSSFDRVVSSLFFHHLSPQAKLEVAAEASRVLRPGGSLHVADWGRPPDLLARGLILPVRLLDGFENTRDNVAGRLPAVFESAGFVGVREARRFRTMLGSLSLYEAGKG